VEPIRFSGRIRFWDATRGGGLAVVDIAPALVPSFGGLKQQRVAGAFGGFEFVSSVMPAGGGRLALSVSKAMMKAASVGVGDDVGVEVTKIGRD
jgi:hypothetical protein